MVRFHMVLQSKNIEFAAACHQILMLCDACLGGINVMVGAAEALAEFVRDAGAADGLHSECGVPQLRPVVALHLHASLRHPQEVVQTRNVPV